MNQFLETSRRPYHHQEGRQTSNAGSMPVMASNNDTSQVSLPVQAGPVIGASGPEILGIVWGMTAFSSIFLVLRLWVKLRSRKGLWWDDHLLAASWGMLALFAAATTVCVHVGLGHHVRSEDILQTPLQLGVNVATLFSVLGAAWSKTSFALTLLRITREGGRRVVYLGIWGVIVSMNLVLVLNGIIQFTWCMPAAKAWDPTVEGTCWKRSVVVQYTQFAAYYSAAMDFALALVPWKVLLGLRMRLKEKVGVLVCMSLGMFAGATSIMRAITVPTLNGTDYSYEAGQLFIWTGAELATTIVAASIPILRVLLSDMVHSRYPHPATELKSLKDEEGIRVTRTTVITRSPSKAERGMWRGDAQTLAIPSSAERGMWKGDADSLTMPSTPDTPGPTYHSFLQKP